MKKSICYLSGIVCVVMGNRRSAHLYYKPDGTMAYVEQTKESVTVQPKSPQKVALITNPFPDESVEVNRTIH